MHRSSHHHCGKYVILEAPSTLGLSASGVEHLPGALLSHGLADRLPAIHAGRVEPAARGGRRDPQTTVLNGAEIVEYTYQLADAVGPLLEAGGFPVVLGGDCTIVLGAALALRRRGRYGLLFIDGQADFFQPEAEPNGEAASMDLAFVTGFGPKSLTHFDGLAPLIQPGDAVAFGFRDEKDQKEYGSQPLPAELRADSRSAPNHPAQGARTIYNPLLDVEQRAGKLLAAILADALAPALGKG